MNSYNFGGIIATLIKGIGLLIKKILWIFVAITCGGAILYLIGLYAILIKEPTIYALWFAFFGLIFAGIGIGALRKVAGKTFFPHKKNYRVIKGGQPRNRVNSVNRVNRNYIGGAETLRISKTENVNTFDQLWR